MFDFQIPRQTLVYLLASLSFILIPHIPRSYVALPIIWIIASYWQWKIFQQAWNYPNTWIKFALIGAGIAIVWFQYRSFSSLEFVTQMLLMALLLKLLEMKQKRDVLIIIYLSYFSILTQLLFSQNIASSIYVIIAIILITACLVSLYQSELSDRRHALVLSIKLFFVSLPLMMAAFIIFPRIDPLWSVPNFSQSSKTGLSGRMSPGDFTNLQQSDKLVMRVEFKGNVPRSSSLYWRAIVLENFNGRQWTPRQTFQYRSLTNDQLNQIAEQTANIPNRQYVYYQITQEPTFQPWLFSLDELMTSTKGEYFDTRVIGNKKPIFDRTRYSLSSDLNRSSLQTSGLPRSLRLTNTYLPQGFNPRAIEFAKQLRLKVESDSEFAQAILSQIHNQEFYYTHQPPILGKHSVDEFWFDQRLGLCEHYSQAMAVMFRAVGIPARIVTGFQGGTINPFEDYLMVREKDAHAWVEAWVDDQGWQRFDPTFAIAAQRILSDDLTNDLLSDPEQIDADQASLGAEWQAQKDTFNFLQKAQFKLDQLNYAWQREVMSFDNNRQVEVLNKVLGQATYLRIAIFLCSTFAGIFLSFQLYQYWFYGRFLTSQLSQESKYFHQLLKKLEKQGMEIDQTEPPMRLLKRLKAHEGYSNQQLSELERIITLYNTLQYAPKHPTQRDALFLQLKQSIKAYR